MHGIRVMGLVVAITPFAAYPAEGGLLHVPSEYPTVQAAMTSAVSGDSVIVAPGTYTNCDLGPCSPSVVMMKSGVDLVSESGAEVTVLRVDHNGGGLSVVRGVGITDAVLSGFTITATFPGYGGAAFLACSGIEIVGCRFVDIDSGLTIGGGLFTNGTHVTVRDCEFIRCSASQEGGGCVVLDGNGLIERCLFEECVGGAASINGHSGLWATVRDCVFKNNTANTALALVQMPQAEVSRCVFTGNSSPQNATAIVSSSTNGTVSLRDNLFVGNDASLFRSVVSWASSGEIRGNVFYGNASQVGYATLRDNAEASTVRTIANNIFMQNSGGPAFRLTSSPPQAACNLFWSNPGGDYLGYVPSPTDLFVDPLFCDPETFDFHLESGSPCLPENSGECGLIGAFGQGCGTVSVERESWGKLKAAYR